MPVSRSDLANPPRRVPHLQLPALGGDGDVPLMTRRTAPILLLLHSIECAECRAYVMRVAALAESIAEWDGRVVVVVPTAGAELLPEAGLQEKAATELPFTTLEDRGDRLLETLAIDLPAVIVADQWGEIFERHEAGDGHDFLAPDELVQWARFIAVKCPECEGESF